jgi:transferase family hexapeptide repeat protein
LFFSAKQAMEFNYSIINCIISYIYTVPFTERRMENKIKIIKTFLREISFNTIYFNFKYFPFKQAIRLPVFVSRHVFLLDMKGTVIIDAPFRTRLIKIGYRGVGIFDHKRSRTIWQVSGTVVFKGKASVGHGSKISVGDNAKLIFGEMFVITAETSIIAYEKIIQFGNHCILSWDTLIMDTDFHKIFNEKNQQINPSKNVLIGNNVWIGCRCLILKGTIIPDNSIIAAGSLVNNSLDGEHKIFGGHPAKELARSVGWEE